MELGHGRPGSSLVYCCNLFHLNIYPQSQGCADCDDPPEACVSLLYAELAKGGALDTGT